MTGAERFGIASVVVVGVAMVSMAIAAVATSEKADSAPVRLCADKLDSVQIVDTSDGATCVIFSFLDGSSKTLCDRPTTG